MRTHANQQITTQTLPCSCFLPLWFKADAGTAVEGHDNSHPTCDIEQFVIGSLTGRGPKHGDQIQAWISHLVAAFLCGEFGVMLTIKSQAQAFPKNKLLLHTVSHSALRLSLLTQHVTFKFSSLHFCYAVLPSCSSAHLPIPFSLDLTEKGEATSSFFYFSKSVYRLLLPHIFPMVGSEFPS